jgi:hypothetical protein
MGDDKMHPSISKNDFKRSHDVPIDRVLGQTHVQN